MKQPDLIQKLDSILAAIPTDTQINVSLRYGGPDELKKKLGEIRDRLVELKNEIQK